MAGYPTVEDVIEANALVVEEIKVRKADKHEVLGREKIDTCSKIQSMQKEIYAIKQSYC